MLQHISISFYLISKSHLKFNCNKKHLMLLHLLFLATVIATHDIRFKMAPTKYLTTYTVKLFILLNGERIWTWLAQDTHEAQYSSADRYHFAVTHCISWGEGQCTPLHNVGTYLPSSQKTVAVRTSHSYRKCNVRRAVTWNLKFPQHWRHMLQSSELQHHGDW